MDTTLHHTSAAKNSTVFKHRPLDHSEPSIRLVYLFPTLSPNGQIRCSITHATVDAEYICLSYQWGNPSPSRDILINGKTFTIRQNLFEFLVTAREKAASNVHASLGPFWIDAICIDQSNVSERNHQVRQMGTLYTNALQVYAWLGPMIWGSLTPGPVSQQAKASPYDWETFLQDKDLLSEHVVQNVYWTRAWIVQEVVLARQVTLWLGTASIGLGDMVQRLDRIFRTNRKAAESQLIFRLGRPWMEVFYKDKNLVCLLDYFRGQQCSDLRDRIFSLLSLATGNGKDLEVNYRVSRAELAAEVLRHCRSSLCLCTAILVVRMLELGNADLSGAEPSDQLLPCLEFCIERIPTPSIPVQGLGPQSRLSPPGFWNFSATCGSAALFPARLSQYLTYCGDAGFERQDAGFERQIAKQGYGNYSWKRGFIVRVSLSYLATMLEHPVEICVQARRESNRAGLFDLPAGYPRICYTTDHMDQPGTAKLFSRRVQKDRIPTAPKRTGIVLDESDIWLREPAFRAILKRRKLPKRGQSKLRRELGVGTL